MVPSKMRSQLTPHKTDLSAACSLTEACKNAGLTFTKAQLGKVLDAQICLQLLIAPV